MNDDLRPCVENRIMRAENSASRCLILYLLLIPVISSERRRKNVEENRLGCGWQPLNSSFECTFSTGNPEYIGTQVDFSQISSRHQRESTQSLSLNCHGFNIQLFPDDFPEQIKRSPKSGSYFYHYDGGSFRSNRNKKKLLNNYHWPLLQSLRFDQCPISTSQAVSRRSYPGSVFLGVYLSLFGGIPLTKSNQRLESKSALRSVDVSSNNLDRNLFSEVHQRSGRNRKFLQLECEEFGVKLQHLNASFNAYKSIKSLGLSNCDKELRTKRYLRNLKSLNLNGNLIRSHLENDDLDFAHNLEELYLAANGFNHIQGNFFQTHSKLKILDLSSNNLAALAPDLLANLGHLSELYLQNNSFQSLPPAFEGLSSLVVLNLSKNSIAGPLPIQSLSSKLLSPFSTLKRLVALDLSHNKITSIGRSLFQGLDNLQVLTLAHNEIQSLDGAVLSNLVNLRALVLSENKLKSLHPASFHRLGKLHSLSLDHNLISVLPR